MRAEAADCLSVGCPALLCRFCVEVEGVDVGSSRGRAGGTHDHLEKKLSQGPAGPAPRGRNACSHRAAIRRCPARGQCAGRGKGSGGSSVAGRRLAAECLDAQRPLTAVGKRGDVSGAQRHDSSHDAPGMAAIRPAAPERGTQVILMPCDAADHARSIVLCSHPSLHPSTRNPLSPLHARRPPGKDGL